MYLGGFKLENDRENVDTIFYPVSMFLPPFLSRNP
jgi:hypothetical protein